MKLLTLFLALFLSFQASAHRVNEERPVPLLQFLSQIPGVKQIALYSLIAHRCTRYAPTKVEQKACKLAVEKKIQILNFDVHNDFFVAFRKNLISLMADPKTGAYLTSLQQELNSYMTSDKPMPTNLWQFTVNFYGDKFKAAQTIATLFQDTSPDRGHIAYLDKADIPRSKIFTSNRELLEQVLATFELMSTYSANNFQQVFYPREVKNTLNKAIYHFYVPLYLAMALKKNGVADRYAMMAPSMMTLTYEFISFNRPKEFSEYFADPESINGETPEGAYNLRDMLAGNSGARFAVGLISKAPAFEDLSTAFTASTQEGANLLLAR